MTTRAKHLGQMLCCWLIAWQLCVLAARWVEGHGALMAAMGF